VGKICYSHAMTSAEIRSRFLEFFKKRGHVILPSASLVPENDPSVLFNTAGMQPLVPYLMGQKHPAGSRLASCQKCVRTGDLEDIGDNRHFSFFEMLGNWSLGDYFKEDAIRWSYEFLTSKEEGLGLDPSRLYVTVFEGDDNAPRDTETPEIWKSLGIPESRIYFLGSDDNWWSPGDNGPCGPDSEMFYDMTPAGVGELSKDEFIAAVQREDLIEIWNDVFMEYEKRDGKVVGKLSQQNVDTGAGLERLTAVIQGKFTAYDTDIFVPIMDYIRTHVSSNYNERSARIIADHIRTAVFMIADGVTPSSKDQGYILRRLIRRALVQMEKILLKNDTALGTIFDLFVDIYKSTYPEVARPGNKNILYVEAEKFQKSLTQGMKEYTKGTDPFVLVTTYGFPIEIIEELAADENKIIDRAKFDADMAIHQAQSRAGAEQKFKGGLANSNEQTVRLHTAHHLLLAALQKVLGSSVKQKGSNITDERLRIDFSFDRKMTDEEKAQVQKLVNEWIAADYDVVMKEMSKEEAETIGAEMEFGAKYGDRVSVYFIQDKQGNPISKEFCGGPHVTHTGELGIFKIQKEEASSAGVRRIKAILE